MQCHSSEQGDYSRTFVDSFLVATIVAQEEWGWALSHCTFGQYSVLFSFNGRLQTLLQNLTVCFLFIVDPYYRTFAIVTPLMSQETVNMTFVADGATQMFLSISDEGWQRSMLDHLVSGWSNAPMNHPRKCHPLLHIKPASIHLDISASCHILILTDMAPDAHTLYGISASYEPDDVLNQCSFEIPKWGHFKLLGDFPEFGIVFLHYCQGWWHIVLGLDTEHHPSPVHHL